MKKNKKAFYTVIKVIFIILIVLFVLRLFIKDTINSDVDPMYDGDGRYYSDLKLEDFIKDEDDKFFVYEDDNYYSVTGIDVSEHQGKIDFTKVKSQGIDFVFIRVGYRGYISGEIKKDARFEQYYTQAKNAGLRIGVYFFSAATTSSEAKEEAEFVNKYIKDKDIDLGVAYDLEEIYGSITRYSFNSIHTNTIAATTFMNYFANKGYKAYLYASPSFLRKHYDIEIIKDYPLWLAFYTNTMQYKYTFEVWQYSPEGELEGIDTDVDFNLMLIPKD